MADLGFTFYPVIVHLENLKDGHKESLKEVAGCLKELIENNQPIEPKELRNYILSALDTLEKGKKKPDAALLYSQRKRPKNMFQERDYKAAEKVFRLMKSGTKYEVALLEVGKEMHMSRSQVKRAYSAFKSVFENTEV